MAGLQATLCLLGWMTLLATNPTFVETDSFVFPNDGGIKMGECIKDNKIEYNGRCHDLYKSGEPCEDDEWLVLDRTSATLPTPAIRGKCIKRMCSSPSEHYWKPTGMCLLANQSTFLCPAGNEIATDYFGDGVCQCKIASAPDRTGVCYPVYSRGPCDSQRMWWVRLNGQMHCVPVPKRCSPIPDGSVMVPWVNNGSDIECFPAGERGSCKEGTVLAVDGDSLLPACVSPLATLTLVGPPCSGKDHSGNCVSAVSATAAQNNLLTKVIAQANRKRTKRS